MNHFKFLEHKFAQALTHTLLPLQQQSIELTKSAMPEDLIQLIDAMPYYQQSEVIVSIKDVVGNQLGMSLPQTAIKPQPNGYELGGRAYHTYNGDYKNYQQAFYHRSQTPAAQVLQDEAVKVSQTINKSWWTNTASALLEAAISARTSLSVNTDHLYADLEIINDEFSCVVAPLYFAVFTEQFVPTHEQLKKVNDKGITNLCRSALIKAILDQQFTANINISMEQGGEDTVAATWFLFNLWTLLKALDETDIEGNIDRFKRNGLIVPNEIDANNWWTGGYSSWFEPPLNSDYIPDICDVTMKEKMPQKTQLTRPGLRIPSVSKQKIDLGYSKSFCYWR